MRKGLQHLIGALGILISVQQLPVFAGTAPGSSIVNYGDKNLPKLAKRFKQLEKKQSRDVIKIIQFGDSHTAADFFSGSLRNLLQQRYGDAGIGWVTPMMIPGQYHAGVRWETKNWKVVSSRNVDRSDYPMGGFIATPEKRDANLKVIPVKDDRGLWQITLRVKPLQSKWQVNLRDRNGRMRLLQLSKTRKQWQSIQFTTTAPFTLLSDQQFELGSIFLQKKNAPGVILSPIGTNGARQVIWHKWQADWSSELKQSQADMVILSYGTNEAFMKQFNEESYREDLIQSIKLIRKQLPHAVILMVGLPDSMVKNSSPTAPCPHRQPPAYYQVKRIQQQVAKQQKILYWDWQQAMGGACIIAKWQLLDLARPDLVHLSRRGYDESAKMFFNALNELVHK